MISAPAVSIVIPTCNRPDLLSLCLDHLSRSIQASGRTDIEVVITDDSADARTQLLIQEQYPWARWFAGPRGGPARNRNSGVAHASGKWIFFTDDDCLPTVGWVGAFLKAIADSAGSFRVFEGRTVADRDPRRLDEEAPVNTHGGYLWGCNMAVERELFVRIGGFCEGFPHPGFEDSDFRVCLVEAGEKFPFVADAEVCHPLRPAKGLAYQMKVAPSYTLLLQRHPELLGKSPWIHAALNFLRRLRVMWRRARQMHFRGFGFALGTLAITTWSELLAVSGRRRAGA